MTEGIKHDQDKRDPIKEWDLQHLVRDKQYWLNIRNAMPHEHRVIGAARAMAYGAAKYDWDNWKLVDNAVYRYAAAALRHFNFSEFYWEEKSAYDAESGLHHYDHACACIAFILWFLEEGKG